MIELLQSSLLSVVPSLWYENTPNSLLESLACGTPVIASDLGSMHDIMTGTGAGLLCRPGDADALAEALRQALSDAPALEAMGCRARELAGTRHSPETHADGLVELLSGLRPL